MKQVALAVVISLLAGFAVGAWLKGDDSNDNPESATGGAELLGESAAPNVRLARIEAVLAEEREARIALEDTLAMLFEELERLEGAGTVAAAQRQAELEREREARSSNRRSSRNEADWMQTYQDRRVGRLVEGGFTEDEARRVLETESEAQYKAMQAAWEAQRNGENPDMFSSLNSAQSILRANIGDDAYARYLEAQGQRTSIGVTQVMSGSPAMSSGLEVGDQIVSYNGERVFSSSDLRSHTMQGDPGEDVVIEVDRDGMRMQLTLPRGPIGIMGTGANIRTGRWWGG